MVIIRFIIIALACSILLPVQAQVKTFGIPFIKNHSKEEYNSGTQNWSIVQDNQGFFYFGNNNGILRFDGKNWYTYPMPNLSITRSLCVSKKQDVYAGALNEFGVLEVQPNGSKAYRSLSDKLNPSDRNFGEIWRIFETDKGIWFQSFSHIFLWNGKELRTLLADRNFLFSFFIGKDVYIYERSRGILVWDGNTFTNVPGSDIFNDMEIWTIMPHSRNRILIGTFSNGIYIFDGKNYTPWQGVGNEFLKKNQIFCATKLGNSMFAFGTIQDGVIITDLNGKPLQHLNRVKGLQNNTVLSIFSDANSNLWLGLDNGIDFIESNSPMSYLNPIKEIGTGYKSVYFKDYLYLGTNQGLFRKKWSPDENPIYLDHFEKIENTQGQVWTLHIFNDNLFCGHDKGTFLITDNRAEKISKADGGWKLFTMPQDPSVLIEGTYYGFYVLGKINGKWQIRNKIKGFEESSRLIEVDSDSSIWMSHGSKGIFHIKINNFLDSVTYWHLYTYKDGLPSNYNNNVLKIKDEIVFTTDSGIYKFNAEKNRFEIHEGFNTLYGKKGLVSKIIEGKNGLFWYIQNNEPGVMLTHLEGNFSVEKTPLRKLKGSFNRSFEDFLQIDEHNVIIAVENGFIHYDPAYKKGVQGNLECYIKEIRSGNDSVIFGGYITDRKLAPGIVAYKYNGLKIKFVANAYADIEKVNYSFRLSGFDPAWSDWSTATAKEYTNLPEGTYTFKVKARDVYGNESKVAEYEVVILAPWYRTIFAFIGYGIVILFMGFFVTKRVVRKFEEEKTQLKIKQKARLEEQQRLHESEFVKSQQEIVKLKNEMLELENEKNKLDVERKNKELASLATQITRKNEILEKIKSQLNKLGVAIKTEDKRKLDSLIKTIDQDIRIDDDWERFEKYFDQVHGDFIKRLKDHYPQLTPTDLKLCAYLKMNISSKEIAPLLNISVRSVEVSRYRLRKKLGLSQTDNLIDFMLGV